MLPRSNNLTPLEHSSVAPRQTESLPDYEPDLHEPPPTGSLPFTSELPFPFGSHNSGGSVPINNGGIPSLAHVFTSAFPPQPAGKSLTSRVAKQTSDPDMAPGITTRSSPSSDPQNPQSRLHIDARAAELKERLLKSRTHKSSRDSSLTPQATAGPDKKPVPGSNLQSSAASPFVPHPMPKQPPENSVPADANDIAALILSISSASQSGEARDPPRPSNPAAPGGSARQSQGLQSQGFQHSAKPTAEVKAEAKADSEGKPARKASPPEEGEITGGSANHGSKTSASERQHQNQSSPPQASTAATKGSTAFPTAPKNPKVTRPAEMQNRPSTASFASHSHSAGPKQHTNHEPRELVPSNTYYRTSAPSSSRDVDDERATRPDEQCRGENEHGTNEPINSKHDSSQQLATLLERDVDLRDWLTLTQYFDTEARTRKLTRYRKLTEIDAEQKRMQAEQQRIDAERQKLLAEEESDRGMVWQASTPTALPTPTPLPPALLSSGRSNSNGASASSKPDNDPATPMPSGVTQAPVEHRPSIPAKRASDNPGNEIPSRSAKLPRLEGQGPEAEDGASIRKEGNNDCSRDNRPLSSNGPESKYREPPGRDPSPRRRGSRNSPPGSYRGEYRGMSPSHQREPSPRRPPMSPGYRSRSGYVKYGNYRGDSGRPVHRRSPSPMGWRDHSPHRYPKHIDLGGSGG